MYKDDDPIDLVLTFSTWKNIFHVLYWSGLKELDEEAAQHYYKKHGHDFSLGNFWAAIQSLEGQLENHMYPYVKTTVNR